MIASKYFGESQYRQALAIENYREVARWFEKPSYMTPPNGFMPKAEIGLCCPEQNESWHPWFSWITHHFP